MSTFYFKKVKITLFIYFYFVKFPKTLTVYILQCRYCWLFSNIENLHCLAATFQNLGRFKWHNFKIIGNSKTYCYWYI